MEVHKIISLKSDISLLLDINLSDLLPITTRQNCIATIIYKFFKL